MTNKTGIEKMVECIEDVKAQNQWGQSGILLQFVLDRARSLRDEERKQTEGLVGALKDRISFEIGLYEDCGVKAVIIEQDDGGFRLSNSKATGSWNLIKKFECSASVDEMFPEILKRHTAKDGV